MYIYDLPILIATKHSHHASLLVLHVRICDRLSENPSSSHKHAFLEKKN